MKRLALLLAFLTLNIALAEEITVNVNVRELPGYAIMKTLVGLGMGIGFLGLAITLFFGIDFFKTKNPLVSIVMSAIGLAVILIMFAYLWSLL